MNIKQITRISSVGLLASLLGAGGSVNAQTVVFEDMATTTFNVSTTADNTAIDAFSTSLAPTTNGFIGINTDFNGDPSIAILGNIESNNTSTADKAITYVFDSTGLTGQYTVSFDLAVIDDGVQGAGDALANPTLDFTMWGEVHPWNTANTFNYTTEDNGGFFADRSQLSPIVVDTAAATTTIGGSYTSISHTFDLGPAGFDHGADGGTPGGNFLYFTINWANMSGNLTGGDAIFIDNFEIAVAGTSTPVAPLGVEVAIAGADVKLTFDTVAGQTYALLVSTDGMQTFNPVGEPGSSGTGDGNPLTLTDVGGAPAAGSKVFYAVETN
ncbi:MAG: hypothetical protein ACP5I4_02050 [Oceanipulchritudo sp.]